MSSVLAKEVLEIVNDLDASQLKLEKNAFDVINSSDTSLNLVKDGIGAIEDLVKKIDDLNEAVKLSQQNIEHMKDVSNVIADFAKVISGIANKTNILSLNASIEAARAGEHGRGFSVVAQQVQSLASQTKNSSAEITTKINEVQSFMVGMVDYMNEIYANAEQQNKMAASIGDLLKKVLDAAYVANDVSRHMENEIAYQRDITDKARTALDSYTE
ncbi:MAG: chemotaxis protein [Lachnospiraceae bacterium]|jgi:Methyl-accepting chemotaxis protein|nr:chemotaxis protein [Lachnospiraceae bacterium]MCI8826318.1 chemotaxis protein [Lachnospiraceae bacterium]MCI9370763.1 chemotaxis protein [Lachnospiraceae bacterium]MDE7307600.1 chemotaxis protein [Lachnospiraceae bacterium]